MTTPDEYYRSIDELEYPLREYPYPQSQPVDTPPNA